MDRVTNFIDGAFVEPHGGQFLPNIEPATGREIGQVAQSSPEDIDAATRVAQRAFASWAGRPSQDRSRLLQRLADLLERDLEAFAQAESRDTGKPISLARVVDIPRSITNLRFFATSVLHTESSMHETDAGATPGAFHAINYTLRRPRGVAGLISPWNLPLYLLTWKIAPALATGNTVVCKPSEITPTTASMLAKLSIEAGLPPGVLNVVHGAGEGAGGAIVKHADIPTISFTGSTGVGRWIAREAGERLKRVSLELGGKNPMIIFEDADIDDAIATLTRAAFTNQGQVCLCASRVLIHRKVFDRVRDGIVARASSLKPGDPSELTCAFGALSSAAHLAKVSGIVERARRQGVQILCGGGSPAPNMLPARCEGGFFYLPTVITGTPRGCELEQEEIFGPVISLQPFDTDDEAISLANSTKYGLATTIFTHDVSRAHAVAAAVDCGIVWINCWMLRDLRTPFGGSRQSGVGREGGSEAMRFFTEPKNVCVRV
jgi:aminomuconate-semialdehyde/2-hydroxymuconate-6-semialdehyde dehydrogenase